MDDIQIRYLIRDEPTIFEGVVAEVKVLQYRKWEEKLMTYKELDALLASEFQREELISQSGFGWSEWKDVPIVEE